MVTRKGACEERASVPVTIQNETSAWSGLPNLSEPSSSCRRWDSPGCRPVRGGNMNEFHWYGKKQQPSMVRSNVSLCTWCRARPRGGSPESAGTESTGERNAPLTCLGGPSANQTLAVNMRVIDNASHSCLYSFLMLFPLNSLLCQQI